MWIKTAQSLRSEKKILKIDHSLLGSDVMSDPWSSSPVSPKHLFTRCRHGSTALPLQWAFQPIQPSNPCCLKTLWAQFEDWVRSESDWVKTVTKNKDLGVGFDVLWVTYFYTRDRNRWIFLCDDHHGTSIWEVTKKFNFLIQPDRLSLLIVYLK